MDRYKFLCIVTAAIAFNIIGVAGVLCPRDPNCVCGGTLAVELNCNIDGDSIKISVLQNTYITIQCKNPDDINYDKLPMIGANHNASFKSVIFKECPLPSSSFKDVLIKLGVSKTMSLIFQNSKNLSSNLDKRQFDGLQDLSKLLLSVNGITYLPDNLFEGLTNLTWLNIRSNGISLSQNLFRPLERLETLEISHNHMTNISGNLFSHLTFLRKLSLWQNNVTRFSKDLFSGVNVLEELDLSSNGLNELPSTIFTPLRKLKKLTLFSNKFSTLPSNLFKNNEGLDTIIIFNNDVKLKYLPKGIFSGLNQLKEVYVQRCGLEIIPIDTFNDSPLITNISLAHNEIESLQESVFNDQINLLDLDLSYNKLKSLPRKLFSSLVKLERLKLGYNSLKDISSFSSLISLSYFDIERNALEYIPQGIFNNNRQRMWINMAYNRIKIRNDDEINNIENESTITNSPFAHLHHLKMLNLSHNQLQITYDDWWINGHESLDLSFNEIHNLTDKGNPSLLTHSLTGKKLSTKLLTKQIWIASNPIACNCGNYIFLSAIQQLHIKIADIETFRCPITLKISCDRIISEINVMNLTKRFSFILFILFCVMATALTTGICITKHKRRIYVFVKKICYKHVSKAVGKNNRRRDVYVAFAESDHDFVITELLPALKCQRHLKIYSQPINDDIAKNSKVDNFTDKYPDKSTLIVILSLNYLKLVQKGSKIDSICGDTSNINVVFVLTNDISMDTMMSVFTVKQLISMKNCTKFNHPNFWDTLLKLVDKEGESTCIDINTNFESLMVSYENVEPNEY